MPTIFRRECDHYQFLLRPAEETRRVNFAILGSHDGVAQQFCAKQAASNSVTSEDDLMIFARRSASFLRNTSEPSRIRRPITLLLSRIGPGVG